ncbi:hypothetical protein OGR47_16785 [Methylocystis sp. MJC1]|jgi:hypothetical protein|uniref:hypothetical protein n=1 Tax=Methylocystis sp. MJC1 TaxID=2654282 RepID=UPI0013EABEF0|nr:hypothetical protein [Methylocystis sp. MJC1]KAF2990790.1 hypothetical protein MJC1_02215 [Methylocystis sp. MJC1]MBU6528613.1 hypothetical protein [Methylocystis sp. MJC1]UZX11506.1 hypothetical protein OGR47_16785 [Methylocystis sp. MJC1]
MQPDATAILGPFRLCVDPERAEAYARETGGDGKIVPLSFPAVWLMEPTLFAPVREICAALDVVPVHESQSFAYETPLAMGARYDVSVSLRREETPSRLIIDATIFALDGAKIGKSETMLRLVSRAGLGAGS